MSDVFDLSVDEAQFRLQYLIDAVRAGSRVRLVEAGVPVAELVPVDRDGQSPTFPGSAQRASSDWRELWSRALDANREMAIDPAAGDRAFRELLDAYPNDGMVRYEYAEALEYARRYSESAAYYAEARKLFPSPKWQQVAQFGRDRAVALSRREGVAPQIPARWDVFHLVHACPYLPQRVRFLALSALSRIDAEPELALGAMRACLDMLEKDEGSDTSGLETAAKVLRGVGGVALHQGLATPESVSRGLEQFRVILRTVNGRSAKR